MLTPQQKMERIHSAPPFLTAAKVLAHLASFRGRTTMAIEGADKIALETIGLLSYRLRRIEFLLTGSDEGQEQLHQAAAQGRDYGIPARLAGLENNLARLSSKSAIIKGLLTLCKWTVLQLKLTVNERSCCTTRSLPPPKAQRRANDLIGSRDPRHSQLISNLLSHDRISADVSERPSHSIGGVVRCAHCREATPCAPRAFTKLPGARNGRASAS